MNKTLLLAGTLLLSSMTRGVSADVTSLPAGLINLETVAVGDAGNSPDAGQGGYGAVAYPYRMGKYEVTTGQYTEFLNAIAKTDTHHLWTTNMSFMPYHCGIQRSGEDGNYQYTVAPALANRPVNYVNYWDACRFVNWLHNGQPTGKQDNTTTEDGAYALNGYEGSEERPIRRKPGAKWFLPTENEWYKAAYYKGGGSGAGYWNYPTKSDNIDTNMANYQQATGSLKTYLRPDWTILPVGSYRDFPGPYGTFDQAGNMTEWNEVSISGDSYYRGVRGGGFWYGRDGYYLRASTRIELSIYPTFCAHDVGFRVAAAGN